MVERNAVSVVRGLWVGLAPVADPGHETRPRARQGLVDAVLWVLCQALCLAVASRLTVTRLPPWMPLPADSAVSVELRGHALRCCSRVVAAQVLPCARRPPARAVWPPCQRVQLAGGCEDKAPSLSQVEAQWKPSCFTAGAVNPQVGTPANSPGWAPAVCAWALVRLAMRLCCSGSRLVRVSDGASRCSPGTLLTARPPSGAFRFAPSRLSDRQRPAPRALPQRMQRRWAVLRGAEGSGGVELLEAREPTARHVLPRRGLCHTHT